MSCEHGNWAPCEQCDALDAAYNRGYAAGSIAALKPDTSSAGDGEWRKILSRLLDLGQDVHQVAPALGGEMIEQMTLLRREINRLASPIAGGQASEVDALSLISGLTFHLHENPDSDADPVQLVMAMSVGNQVFCHRITDGNNGICRDADAQGERSNVKKGGCNRDCDCVGPWCKEGYDK